jgi:histone acetyltransferase (RNA polymerase elongator complex component)
MTYIDETARTTTKPIHCEPAIANHCCVNTAQHTGHCNCRCREVRDQEFKDPTLTIRKYASSGGTEYFISFESPDEKVLYGFLRLRIPSRNSQCLPELKGCALIRELHVYGKLRAVTKTTAKRSTSSSKSSSTSTSSSSSGAANGAGSSDAVELQDTVEVLAGKLPNGDVQEDEVDVGASQHQGLGGQLLAKAESIALRHGKR